MTGRVPFLDLSIADEFELNDILKAIEAVLRQGRLVMGPEIDVFEAQVAAYCGRRFCVSVGSGTDALFLSLKALGIGAGDEVITTSLSWIATANAIALTGATPVFADIGDDLNIDPDSVERLISPLTRAVLSVDYTGRLAALEALESICARKGLHLVEDGSQAFGATRNGRRCGNFGVMAAISHNPMKVFAALGEAGSIVCDDEQLYERLVCLRYNGTINRETCVEPSLNGRMDTIQAAILIKRLREIEKLVSRRRSNAAYYIDRLAGKVQLPEDFPEEAQVYYTFTIRTQRRNELERFLSARDIETKVQYRMVMPEHPAYKTARGEFTNAIAITKTILSLPVHEKLTDDQRKFVADSVLAFFAGEAA
jgi:dTDP-4-amino-4,6-dideoxygalactose transaminase